MRYGHAEADAAIDAMMLDRMIHGAGFAEVNCDGSITHIPVRVVYRRRPFSPWIIVAQVVALAVAIALLLASCA